MPEPSVSSIAIYQLRVVLCGVSPLVWRRLLWSAQPVSPNSTNSFRMPSAGVANICTASLFMARPMGFLVLAALSSGTMPDGCRFLVSVCIAASASAMNTTSWPIGSWTFGWSEFGLLIPTALFHESGRFSGVKPLSWLALERGNTQARTYSLESDPPESPALADMADNRRWQEAGRDVLLRRDNAFGQPRNRHTDISREDLPAGAQRLVGVNDVMPCPPELLAVLRPGRPGEICAAMVGDDFLNYLRLLRHASLRAVEFEPQRRRDWQVEL